MWQLSISPKNTTQMTMTLARAQVQTARSGVHCYTYIIIRSLQQVASTHSNVYVERGTMRVKCLAQERNIVTPATTQTRTDQTWVQSVLTNNQVMGSVNYQRSGLRTSFLGMGWGADLFLSLPLPTLPPPRRELARRLSMQYSTEQVLVSQLYNNIYMLGSYHHCIQYLSFLLCGFFFLDMCGLLSQINPLL